MKVAGMKIVAAAALALGLVFGAGAAQARGPEGFSDLADKVINAVVNISATTTVEAGRDRMTPQIPRGAPFEDLFEEFFNRRGRPGEDGAPRRQRRSSSLGSGFIIDEAGVVVTNNHVVGDANDVEVILNDGTKMKAEVVGKDSKLDLAVLRVKPAAGVRLTAVKFGDSNRVRIGEWVLAIGNPFGLGGSVSAGIVSAINRNISQGPYDSYIQTDAAINKGNSGGPLFNMDGEVIGINTAILSPSGGSVGIGFAVPSSLAAPVIEQLLKYGETRRGWLGVRIQNVDEATAEALGLDRPRGALVAGVDEKGPAKPAGVQVGDVIIRFDGQEVKDSRELPRIVSFSPVGKECEVVVLRKGREVTLKVKLGRLEDGEKELAARGELPGASAISRTLGLELAPLNAEARARFGVAASVKGVLVAGVDPDSRAAERRLQPGDVIVEINQEQVETPADVSGRIAALKKDGKKSALLLVATPRGDMRFVALPVE
ncbi:DegQ family serine endoprotease [Camelimonas abortus]|uniref:Probable periplasmic serine endoprotease DegP-like n=1 Tax=Camelimonas abortus TaxID=1017184 RepID=A0ABV7LH10_9HYPH